jgi:hypothetical protein
MSTLRSRSRSAVKLSSEVTVAGKPCNSSNKVECVD